MQAFLSLSIRCNVKTSDDFFRHTYLQIEKIENVRFNQGNKGTFCFQSRYNNGTFCFQYRYQRYLLLAF